MNNLIDSIFKPLLNWLNKPYEYLTDLSVPLSRPLNISNYFGYFGYLPGQWQTVITTAISLSVIYLIVFVIVNNMELIIRFKNMIKWW